jgi:hypothetical protein
LICGRPGGDSVERVLSSQSMLVESGVGIRWYVGLEGTVGGVSENTDSFEVNATCAPGRAVLVQPSSAKKMLGSGDLTWQR